MNAADRNGDLCPEIADRSFIDECVKNKVQRQLLNNKGRRFTMCEVTNQCVEKSTVTQQCKVRFIEATTFYCNCVNQIVKLNLPDHVQAYSACLKRYSFK